MQIKLVFENSKFIKINLLNKPLINEWFNFFSTTEYYSQISNCPQEAINENMISKHWEEILNVRDILVNWGYQFPYNLKDNFDYRQSTLNDLHRFFTYNILWSHESHKLNPYDNTFIIPYDVDYQSWHQLLDRMNISIHFLEYHTNNSNKNEINSLFKRSMKALHVIPKKRFWFNFENLSYEANQNFLSSEDCIPVVLDDSILGKSFLQSFVTNDDPTCQDCTGRLGSHGGFYIDFNNDRKKLYKSTLFLNWLKKYKLNPTTVPYEFLIGYVSNMSDIPTDEFYNLKLIKVERFEY